MGDSQTAAVTVTVKKEKPRFGKKPADLTKEENQEAVFETTVIGKPDATVEWLFGKVKFENGERVTIEKEENKHRLIIKQLLFTDTGAITIKAKNSEGEVSVNAHLKVNKSQDELDAGVPPQITSGFKDVVLQEGETLSLKAKVSGTPNPEVKWYRNDTEIVNSSKNKLSKDKDGFRTLTIAKATANMTAQYKIVAKNKLGTKEHSATVSVEESVESIEAIESVEAKVPAKPEIDRKPKPEVKKPEPEVKKPEPEVKKPEPVVKKPEPEVKKPDDKKKLSTEPEVVKISDDKKKAPSESEIVKKSDKIKTPSEPEVTKKSDVKKDAPAAKPIPAPAKIVETKAPAEPKVAPKIEEKKQAPADKAVPEKLEKVEIVPVETVAPAP